MRIKIKNWEKYQPRKDIKSQSWFRLNNDLFYDPKICELDHEGLITLLYLFCEASRTNQNGELFLSRIHSRIHSRLQDRDLNRSIKKLQELQIIEQPTLRGRYADVTQMCSTIQYKTEQDTADREKHVSGRAKALPPLASFWNENCGNLPKVKACGKDRTRKAELRLKEKPDLQYWAQVISILKASDFCNGKNERGWRADFDFLLREETANKALEGKYENRKQDNRSANTPGFALKALLKKD